jgi:phosphopantothenoylcysteine decarboxylase/phosphopantothenate--cysteine ligase
VYLSARCPVFVAPAMDVDMWHHPSTRHNVNILRQYGVHVIPVAHGELASGLVGEGRMAEPEDIVAYLNHFFAQKQELSGKKALVTAGPTYEALDPVRFIGNHSTGKMGIAIAENLAARGADVTLVMGPTDLRPQNTAIEVVPVVSAQEMYEACRRVFPACNIAVLAAAVADYRPTHYSEQKIKKKDDDMRIELAKTIDIAATLGKEKKTRQVFVGFALETQDEAKHAQLKLDKKNFDFIVLNSLRDPGAGFGTDTNKISILHRDGSVKSFALKSKTEAAADIVDEIVSLANRFKTESV